MCKETQKSLSGPGQILEDGVDFEVQENPSMPNATQKNRLPALTK